METKTKSLKHYQWMLKLMGWFQIPLIAFVKPRLLQIDSEILQLRIRLRRRTKNHLKSMYFGALAVGADVAAGLHVYYFCEQKGVKPSFAFKGMNVQFLKRAETDVTFVCREGRKVEGIVQLAIDSSERQNAWVNVVALNDAKEEVATFQMEISVKVSRK